jgi:hypothetical protein
MLRLQDFDEAIEQELRRNPDGPESDEIAELLQKSARELLSRQAIHADDHQLKTSYKLLRRHSFYFERLFEALGYQLTFDTSYSYCLLLPGSISTGVRRGRVPKDETVLLFALRVIWEEMSRNGDMDDLGRIEADTEILYDRYTAMSATEFPGKSKLRDYLNSWKARGILRVGEEDREEDILNFTIMPVIRDIVPARLAQEVEIYLANTPDDMDVLEYIETTRSDPDIATDTTESLTDV